MKNILSLAFTTLLLCSQVLAWGNTCSSCTNNQNLLKVATWSVDQSPGFTRNDAARLQGSLSFLTGSEVAALNLNLICLQEIYNSTDRQAIINRVSGSLPYSFSAPAGNQPDCDINTDSQCNLFNGNSGTLILSSLPIQASQVLNFQSQANTNSNALWARVLWNGTPVNFFCTDLLPDDYTNSGVNYESLNLAQTQELLNYINTNVNNNEPVVLAGDFNSGPAVGNNAGVFTNNYNAIIGAGYQNALTTLVPVADVPCTSCNINGQNTVTNHIFIKSNTNPAGCLASVGVFGTNTTVTTSEGVVATSDTVGVWTGICYGGAAPAPPSPAPIQTAIVVQPVQIVSSGATVLPFLAVIAAILAFVF